MLKRKKFKQKKINKNSSMEKVYIFVRMETENMVNEKME